MEIAEKYGQAAINLINRQGVEILGICLEDMDKVSAELPAMTEIAERVYWGGRHCDRYGG